MAPRPVNQHWHKHQQLAAQAVAPAVAPTVAPTVAPAQAVVSWSTTSPMQHGGSPKTWVHHCATGMGKSASGRTKSEGSLLKFCMALAHLMHSLASWKQLRALLPDTSARGCVVRTSKGATPSGRHPTHQHVCWCVVCGTRRAASPSGIGRGRV